MTYRQEGTLDCDMSRLGMFVWWIKACVLRCAGRLRYLELIAGGLRDNLDVQTLALDRCRD